MTRKPLHRQTHTAPTGHASSGTLKRLASVVILANLMLAGATLAFANSVATEGRTRAQVDSEITNLTAENEALRVEVANLTSVSRIYQAALTLGYTSPKELESVGGTTPVAYKP